MLMFTSTFTVNGSSPGSRSGHRATNSKAQQSRKTTKRFQQLNSFPVPRKKRLTNGWERLSRRCGSMWFHFTPESCSSESRLFSTKLDSFERPSSFSSFSCNFFGLSTSRFRTALPSLGTIVSRSFQFDFFSYPLVLSKYLLHVDSSSSRSSCCQ